MTDRLTAEPVRCRVEYFAFADNPNLQQARGFTPEVPPPATSGDGTMRLVGLPGRGLIAVQAGNALTKGYLLGVGADRIPGRTGKGPYRTAPSLCFPEQFHGLAEINPAKDAESVICHVALDPGRTLTGTIVGPDGKPLTGAIRTEVDRIRYWLPEPLKSAEFTIKALKPGESQRVLFLHKGKGLAGSLLLGGEEKGPLTVKLKPWGVVTGRLLRSEGKPLTEVQIESQDYISASAEGIKGPPLDAGSLPAFVIVKPDPDGRFRVEGLVPGLKYRLDIMKGSYPLRFAGASKLNVSVQSGETKDLGDVLINRSDE